MNNNFNNVFALPSRVIGSRMPSNTNNNDNSVLINSGHSHSSSSSSRLNEEQQVSSRFTRYSTNSPAPHHTLTTSRQPRAYLHHQQRQQQLYSMHRNHTNNNNNKNNNHTSIYERTNIVANNNNTVSPMITSHHPSMYAPSSTTTGASMTYGVHPYHQSSDRHAQQPQSMMYSYAPPTSSEMHMFNTSDYTPSPMPTHPHHASQHHDQRTMMMMMVPYPPTVAATTSTTPVPHHHHHHQQQQQLIHSSTTPIPSNVIQHQQQERRQQSSVVPMRSNSLIPIRVQAQYARQILLSPAPTLSSQSTIAMDHNSEQTSHVNTSRSMGDNNNTTTTTTTKQNRAAMMVPLAPLERQKAFEALSRQYIHKPLPKQSTTTTTTTIQNNQQQQPTLVIQSEEHVHSLLEESTSPSLPHVRQQEAVSTVAATTQEETFPQDRQSTTMMDVTTTITATTNMAQVENLEASAKTIRNWYCWFPYMTTFMNHNLHSKRRRHIHHYYDMILCGELEKDISNGGGDMMSNLDEHPKEWHSSIVMNRIHSHLLVTASGTSYRLYPDQCNFEKMCSRNTEVSLEFLQKFKRGVPEDWRQTVDYEYARLLNLDEFDYYSESDYEKNVDEGEFSNEKQQTTQDSIGNGTVEQFDNFDSFMRSMPSPPQDDDFSYYNNSETFGSAADDADDAHESQLGFGSTEDGQTYLEEHDGRRSADVVRSSIPSPPLIHDEDSEMHHEKEKKSPPSAPHRANPLHNKNLVLDESDDEGLYKPDTTEEEDDSDVDSDIGKQRRTTKKPKVSRYRKYESPSNTDESPSDQEDEEVEEGEEEIVEAKEEPSEPITNQSQVVVIDPQQAGDILFDPSFAQVVTQPSQAPAKSLMAVNKKPTLTVTRKRQRTDTTPNTVKKNKKRKEQTPSSQSTRSKHHHFVVAGTDTETESDDSDYNPDQPGYVRPFDARRNRKNRSKRMSISQ